MNPITGLVLFPFRPRRVALAFQHAPLVHVYLVHWLGMALMGCVAVAIDWWGSDFWSVRHRSVALAAVSNYESSLVLLLVLAGGELCFVFTAMAMMCWAGREEPRVETWRYALRVGWLYTGHLIWVATAWSTWFACIANPRSRWDDGSISAMVCLIAAVTVWSIVTYLRAMTAPREARSGVAAIEGPLCEWCGYLLVHIAPDGPCPECGRRVADSTLKNPRREFRASEWKRGRWFRLWGGAEEVLREVAANGRSKSALKMTAWFLGLGAFGGAMTFTAAVSVFGRGAPDVELFPGIIAGVGGFVGWAELMVFSVTASVLGAVASKRSGRNRLTAAWNTMALYSPAYALWCALTMGAMPALMVWRPHPMTFLCWLLGNMGVALVVGVVGAHRLPHVQFSNR